MIIKHARVSGLGTYLALEVEEEESRCHGVELKMFVASLEAKLARW